MSENEEMNNGQMNPYTMVLCLTDGDGLSFRNKHLSVDRVLRSEMLSVIDGQLCVTEYSARQFTDEEKPRLTIVDSLPAKGNVFAEVGPIVVDADKIVIYRWNRRYISDAKAVIDYDKYAKISSRDFAGSSHDNITEEIWIRK